MLEIVDGRTTVPSDWYTISSPMSLRLRRAKNKDNPPKSALTPFIRLPYLDHSESSDQSSGEELIIGLADII